MKWNHSKWITLLVATIIFLVPAMPVWAYPPLPSSFYGTVQQDGQNVPDGTAVEAWIDGIKYVETTTTTWNGQSVYAIDVPGDDAVTTGKEGGVEGETIIFRVGGVEANETGSWHTGLSSELNLTVMSTTLAPDIEVNPASIEVTLPEGGATVQTIYLSNNGNVPLNWWVSVGNTRVLVLRDGAGESRVESVLTAAGFDVSLSPGLESGWDGTNPSPAGFGAIVFLDGSTFSDQMPVAGQSALVDYVQNGGGLILTEWIAYEASSHTTMGNLILCTRSDGSSSSQMYTVVASHPVVEGVAASFEGTFGSSICTANAGQVLVTGSTAQDAVIAAEIGAGRVVEFAAAGNYLNLDAFGNANMAHLLSNAVAWASGDGASWLSTPATGGGFIPGYHMSFDLTIDAQGLTAGTYTSQAIITSDDPDEPVVVIPVTLTVTGGSSTATVRLSPTSQTVNAGQTTTVDVVIDGVTDLYAFDFTLTYGAQVEGVTMERGPEWAGGFVGYNQIDNGAHQARLAVSLTEDAALSGDGIVLGTITFSGVSAGTAALQITGVELLNSQLDDIAHAVENGTIEVVENLVVQGRCYLQLRSNHSGCTVSAGGINDVTGADGAYQVNLPAGSYAIYADAPGYLRALGAASGVAGATINLGDVMLRAGDVNDDCNINILDLSAIGGCYGQPASCNATADLDGDGAVALIDLAAAARNYGQQCEQPWDSNLP